MVWKMALILAPLDPKNVKFHRTLIMRMKSLIFKCHHMDLVRLKVNFISLMIFLTQKASQSMIVFWNFTFPSSMGQQISDFFQPFFFIKVVIFQKLIMRYFKTNTSYSFAAKPSKDCNRFYMDTRLTMGERSSRGFFKSLPDVVKLVIKM